MEPKLEIIAERSLTYNPDGTEKPVNVLIGRPYAESDGVYFCPFRLVGLDSGRIKRAGGIDAIQALQLALVMIGAELSVHAGSLKWGDSVFLGFPKSIHDPVIGKGEE